MINRRSILKSLAGCAVLPGAAAVAAGQGHTPAGGGEQAEALAQAGDGVGSGGAFERALNNCLAPNNRFPVFYKTRDALYRVNADRSLTLLCSFHVVSFPSVAPDFTKPAKPLKHRKILQNNCVETSAPPLSGKPLAGSPNV